LEEFGNSIYLEKEQEDPPLIPQKIIEKKVEESPQEPNFSGIVSSFAVATPKRLDQISHRMSIMP